MLVETMSGRCEVSVVSVVIAFRVAKVLAASIYDVITERALPDGTCQSCGKGAGRALAVRGEAGCGDTSRSEEFAP